MSIRQSARLLLSVLSCLGIGLLLWINLRVYSAPKGSTTPDGLSEDAIPQLHNIGNRLRAGEGDDMQRLFPEGWFFSHALYGFAWVNCHSLSVDPAVRSAAVEEVRWVLKRMESPEGLAPFKAATQVEHGVFYLGWKNRLLGGLLGLIPESDRLPSEVEMFHRQSEQLATAFQASPSCHLDAYPGQAWPCDNVMALASLKLHDALYGTRYQVVIDRWVELTRKHLDPETGLIVHQVDAVSGRLLIPARASTQVYIHALLPELSPEFAREQYALFRNQFVSDWLGFLPVREYPKGRSGPGDVDTGPIVFGISPSATVVSIAAARANRDFELCERNVILSEIVGFPWTGRDGKSFAFGKLVVADAFLVWGKTLVPWSDTERSAFPPITPAWWRWRLHLVSSVLIVLGILVLRRLNVLMPSVRK